MRRAIILLLLVAVFMVMSFFAIVTPVTAQAATVYEITAPVERARLEIKLRTAVKAPSTPAVMSTETPPGPEWTVRVGEFGWWRTGECNTGWFINTSSDRVTWFGPGGSWYGIQPNGRVEVTGANGYASMHLMGPKLEDSFVLYDGLPVGECDDPTPTASATPTTTSTPTATASATPPVSPTPSASVAPTATATATATADPTTSPTVTLTPTATSSPTTSPTATASPTTTSSPTVKPTAKPTLKLTPSASATASVSPTLRPTVTAAPARPSDGSWVYTTPGYHDANGRRWHTICEPYSQIERCFTDIWATQVSLKNGQFVQANGWVFNNLTYTAAERSLWAGNPLGGNGIVGQEVSWVSDGRQWRTECDTATTGRGGCRSYIEATVIERHGNGYRMVNKEMFNNMVRFKN